MHIFTIALAFVALFSAASTTERPKTVCYYESWTHYRHDGGKMDPEDMDNTLCTHIVYSYFGIDSTTHELEIPDLYLMNEYHDMEHFIRNAGKAIPMIAIGGPTKSDQFSRTSSNSDYRAAFVDSVVKFLAKNKLGGIMLDWYGAGPEDTKNMISLLDKFDIAFEHTSYIMSMSVPADLTFKENYDVAKISEYVDFLNVLTLDYAGPWETFVGHASPFPKQFETLETYHKKGVPRQKMLMSVPLFARTWRLYDPSKQEIGDKAASPGSPGPFSVTPGFLSYNELCILIKAKPNQFTIVRDYGSTAVYTVHMHERSAEFISFEDSKTLARKAYNITSEGYAGVTVYSASNDDSHGLCGKKFPLLHAITENYNTLEGTPNGSRPPTTPRVPTSPKTPPPGVFVCKKEGFFRDPVYCFRYFECSINGDFGGFEKIIKYCGRTEAFDEGIKMCVPNKEIKGCEP